MRVVFNGSTAETIELLQVGKDGGAIKEEW